MRDLRLRGHGLIGQGALFNGQGQAIAGLHLKLRFMLHAGQQACKFLTAHCAARCHHTDAAGMAERQSGLERRF